MKYKLLFSAVYAFFALSLHANNLDTNGVTLLSLVQPSLQGNDIWVAQPEATEVANSNDFEVNPASVLQPESLFTWISASGTSSSFTNAVGSESGHADLVADAFYGAVNGVAPQVLHVDNYDADYFVTNFIQNGLSISGRIVNQSFTEGTDDPATDQDYDDYAARHNVLFVSGIATFGGTHICSPASCYNGIAVNAIANPPQFGPTTDGRSKPDIIASDSSATSYATPYVAGGATVLLQAGLRGDGGPDTNAQSDIRLLKALLLNGAVKPADWTNGITKPLDARYGAGVLNVFNAWSQLTGGKHPFVEATSVSSGSPHPPGANLSNESSLVGWDFNSITNSDSSHDRIHHYYFNLTGTAAFTLTSTLVWIRQAASNTINDLNLFLYNTANSNLVLCSTSMVDNVEHLYIPTLPPGRYDLQIEKNGNGEISTNETYALAFEFFNLTLSISQTNTNAVISWPLAPAGFELQSTTNLSPPVSWSTVVAPVTVNTNLNRNVVTVPITGGNLFFRLQRP